MVEMDRSRNRNRRNHKAKKAPKVPIKTYRWEDVRRARRRGGYPWTHLYKGPFTENIDPEQFTMDALRRAKSASPMGRRSDRIEISEVSSWADYSGKTTPTLLQELISEPESTSAKNSRPGSVVIEEYFDDEDKDLEDDVQIKEYPMDTDSDNISQYLDKEDREPTTSKGSKKKINGSKDSITEREKRAKSEETSPRKRKISDESRHSKYSLSRLSVLKRLKDAKSKISFPTKKIPKIRTSPPKEDKPKKETKKKNHETSTRLQKPDKPVYIYIPLKPPPGETDEFSHLEFEEAKPVNEQEVKTEEAEPVKNEEVAVKEVESENKSPFSTLEQGPRVTKKPPLKINPAFKQLLKDVRQLKDKEISDIQSSPANEIKEDIKTDVKPATPDEETLDLEEQTTPDTDSPKETDFDQLFQASAQRPAQLLEETRQERSKSAEPQIKRRPSIDSGYSRKSTSKLALMKKLRDAGEKLKDAGGRIRSALSLDNLKKKFSKEDEEKVKSKQEVETCKPKRPKFGKPSLEKRPTSVVKLGQLDAPKKPVEPVYIHIPLKPPEGQTDAFSHLANEPLSEISAEPKEERSDSLDSTSPISPNKDGIQFIFLTPPSDDEILDKEPDIPETPSSSSDDIMFFGSLKKLAKDAVDQVSPESKKAALETVREESDKGSSTDIEASNGKESEESKREQPLAISSVDLPDEPMIVDAEDGLSEPPRNEEHLKSALKTTTESTGPKRVSFRRKLKAPKDKEPEPDKPNHDYEEIAVPKEESKPEEIKPAQELPQEINLEKAEEKKPTLIEDMRQSMSVEEEKSYLDQKLMKDTSLDDNYKRWSKASSDHEYESVDPPDDELFIAPVISPELPSAAVISGESGPKLIISATEILDKPVEEKKRAFFHIGKFGKDKDKNHEGSSSETQSRSSQVQDIPEVTEPKKPEGPNKFQLAFKQGTEQLKNKTSELKNKIHNIHVPKPNITMPKAPEFKRPHFKKPEFKRPDLKRFKIEKPKINLHMPKIPDTATLRFKNISLPGSRKTSETKTIERRQYSTESNADASEEQTKRHKFDLSFGGTFPRFKKTKRTEVVAFATIPRNKIESEKSTTLSSEGSSSVRVPLHSEDSMDPEDRLALEEEIESRRTGYEDRETSADIDRLSGRRLSEEIALEEEFERENQAINRMDYLRRWQHGNFKERKENEDDADERIVGQLVEQRFGKEGIFSHRYYENQPDKPETLEERLRRDEQRISQYIEDEEVEFDIGLRQNKHLVTDLDNLEDDQAGQGYSSEGSVGLQRKGRLGKLDIDSDEFFVVHEIREGFQTPANALAQMNEYDPIGSNRSLPIRTETEPIRSERKPIKKPKRKKTPHVSREEIPGDEESIEGVIAPSRPRRRSKKTKKRDEEQTVVPYQETISLEEKEGIRGERLEFPRESLGILGDDERDDQEIEMYENEGMKGKEQPKITVTDPYPYKQFHTLEQKFRDKEELPSAPPRKHRSLKSLTMSENDSILTDSRYDRDRSVDTATIEDQILQEQQIAAAPPRRPSRRSRSQTSSLSRMSLPPSQRDNDSIFTDEGYLLDNQQIPSYLIENQSLKEQFQGIDEAPAHMEGELKPCVEEPCVQDIRDYMGYSVTGKLKREPPLPPPRTPTRRRKREVDSEEKFATVPRNMGLNQTAPPARPVRNYSTLSHVRSSRSSKDSTPSYKNDIDKENEVDIGQYMEIDDEIRELVSGEVVRKMRERPLPAPPRPPRKSKTTRKSLQDITSKENILPSTSELKPELTQEETVSTQTEPLPPEFVCEEIKQEPTDTIITPRVPEPKAPLHSEPVVVQRFELHDPRTEQPQVRRELITPSSYTFEETVTHGTLLVQPIDGAKVVPDHQLSRERLVPITRESEDETSEVPEGFRQLKNPEDKGMGRKSETEVLKTEKLQVSDLDVDRLSVNQLLASKLVVSEIDSSTITTNEIQSKSGKIKLSDIELPPQLLEQLVKQLPLQQTKEASDSQKKTPTDSKTNPESVNSPPPSHPLVVDLSLSPVEEPLDRLQEEPSDQYLPSSRLSETETQQRESSVESAEGFQRQHELSPEPPAPPPRGCTLESSSPEAPPRSLRRKSKDSPRLATEEPPSQVSPLRNEMLEPELDDEQPPPRPPQPREGLYLPSQPPASFYALRAKQYVDENIPTAPRRKRHRSRPLSRSRSTSDDSSTVPQRPSRLQRRSSEPSIADLSGRLVQACCFRVNNTLKRLIYHLTENLLCNADGNQDLHVVMVILLVLIAGLILLGYGEDRTVVHLHHWEYFNPPKDL
ncbi:titin isoform X2 [Anthonomus grandis grandis]|uniref:titin isoform X2 n=1 Tax=Anthonomus grandis grandis TaxID=2921223 RepID=UPI0021665929|nr:titin isoform X2 [Anthonomus grandis grandis]